MNLEDRIARRLQNDERGPITDHRALDPSVHLDEPVGRGPVIERLLDALDPVFDDRLPPSVYVWGPAGSGKSAVVTALFHQLTEQVSTAPGGIVTSTRGASRRRPTFVCVDARSASSEFQLYRRVLAAVTGEEVPEGGVATDDIRRRLADALGPTEAPAVVAVDHLLEPDVPTVSAVAEAFDPLDGISWVAIARQPPTEAVADRAIRTVEIPSYEQLTLEDVLSTRASRGFAATALPHEHVRRVAAWAEGNAHDGLGALFGAAVQASDRGAESLDRPDLDAGMAAIPRNGAPLGRVLALAANRRAVLRQLVDLDDETLSSVDSAAAAVADRPGIDLSEGTVTRILYELAESGILERRTARSTAADVGRPPSRVVPRFPTLVFRRLYDAEVGEVG